MDRFKIFHSSFHYIFIILRVIYYNIRQKKNYNQDGPSKKYHQVNIKMIFFLIRKKKEEKKWFELVQEKYSNSNSCSTFKIGVDPNLISASKKIFFFFIYAKKKDEFELREKEFKKHGIEFKPIKGNLVDDEEKIANKKVERV